MTDRQATAAKSANDALSHLVHELALATLAPSQEQVDGTLRRLPPPAPTTRDKRTTPPKAELLALFRRDSFTCWYCGKHTIFLPALHLLSLLYPTALPYHKHWKYTECHPIYWTHTATHDHLNPLARGGGIGTNLVTACYLCQHLKSAWTLEELGWEARPPAAGQWDGLAGLYPALHALYIHQHGAIPQEDRAFHAAWLKAVSAAT